MKTIETKYHGPGNIRGSRYSATDCGDHKVYMSKNYALTSDENHQCVAKMLRDKLGWKNEMVGGHTLTGMVWVLIDSGSPTISGEK